jgi:hypothetical protein
MPKKIQECTMAHLIGVSLPQHAATYTVISHQFVIDYSKQQLAAAGFVIVEEEYRCTADGQIAQGVYKLNYESDPELSMMFAWTNSYNKQVKFKCLIGGYINQTGSVMTSGEVGTWSRKHMGTADIETKDRIDAQINNAHMYYNQLLADKNIMKDITMNRRRQAQLLGVLFAEYQILTTEQASSVREQMRKPYFLIANTDSLWAFYNYVTSALQLSHPRTWMEDQRILHMFITEIIKVTPVAKVEEPVEEVVDPLYVVPNQTNILDQLADLEADQIDEDIRYAQDIDTSTELSDNQVVQEEVEIDTVLHQSEENILEVTEAIEEPLVSFRTEIIDFTDPAGNTFEAPIVPPCAGHDAETEKEEFLSLEPTPEEVELIEEEEVKEFMEPSEANLDIIAEVEDDFDLDFGISDEDEDSSNVPDFF